MLYVRKTTARPVQRQSCIFFRFRPGKIRDLQFEYKCSCMRTVITADRLADPKSSIAVNPLCLNLSTRICIAIIHRQQHW